MMNKNIFFNRNQMFILGILSGLIAGPKTDILSFLNIPILIIIMTAATVEIDIVDMLKNFRENLKPAFAGIMLNHIGAGALMLIPAYLIMRNTEFWPGIVLAAASPPGVGILPFTILLGADISFSAAAVISAFIASIFLAPLLSFYLIGEGIISAVTVLSTILKVLLIPLLLSRFFRTPMLRAKFKEYRGAIVNTGFAVMFAVLFGANRHIFFSGMQDIFLLALIFCISVYGMAFIMKKAMKRSDISEEKYRSVILIGTIKNSLFGATVGYSLVGPEAAVPGTVLTFVIISYLFFIEKFIQRN